MGQGASFFAGVIALALAACGPGSEQSNQTAGADDRGAQERIAHLGPVSYRYNRRLLTRANVRLAIPPESEANINAIKLLPVRGLTNVPDFCPANALDCPVEDQPGVSLALLERPFARYSDALEASDLADRVAPVTVGSTEGIAVDFGELSGLETQYRIIPIGERALLLKLQFDGEDDRELAAMERVIETITFGG